MNLGNKILAACAFVGMLLSGCADDFTPGDPLPEGATGVTISIPRPLTISTRADGDPTTTPNEKEIAAGEGKITSANLYIYKVDDNNNESSELVENVDITQKFTKNNGISHNETTVYTRELQPGKYRFYILANVKGYDVTSTAETLSGEPTEIQVKNVSIKFDSEKQPNLNDGLPMAGKAEDVTMESGGELDATTGTVTIGAGQNVKLNIDLTFLCTKVRYTLLFDNTDNTGFSNIFSTPLTFTNLTVSNCAAETPIYGPSTQSEEITPEKKSFPIESLNHYHFPAAGSTTIAAAGSSNVPKVLNDINDTRATTSSDIDIDNLGAELSAEDLKNPELHQRAVQGILYLPENISEEDASRTTLSFLAQLCNDPSRTFNYNIPLPNGTTDGETDGSTTTGTAAPDPDNTLVRGHYYDLVARVTSPGDFDIRLSVAPWTLQQIVYTLHGPYFLHLDKTVIPVTAGEKTKIWYESNAESVEIDEGYSPKYKLQDGTEVPLYVLDNTTYSDTLIVSVNPLVDAQSLSEDERAQYNYFHLKAGNLRKKIDVEPLRLDPYLEVDPVLITIDARERIASGVYSGDISVNIHTNLRNVTITLGNEDAWKYANYTEDGNTQKALWLTDWNNVEIESNKNLTITSNNSKLNLHYAGINSGWELWKEKRQLTFDVSGKTENGYLISRQVTVNIVNNIQNYTIHFRPPTGWGNPHIYVYQCLEFPAGSALANKPVGADTEGKTAALEYSFTGKIAFKGWNVGSYNNPDRSTGYVNGFYYFTDDKIGSGPATQWAPGQEGFSKHYYDNMDLCEEHREKLKKVTSYEDGQCPHCILGNVVQYGEYNRLKSAGYNMTWPGIQMKKESDEWWSFELTGIATPGKALIMFADGHNYKPDEGHGSNEYQINYRYPTVRSDGMPDPGIPLFDYPNKEGWFDLRNGGKPQFTSSNPEDRSSSIIYRIYWYKDNESNPDYRDYIQYNDGKGGSYEIRHYSGSEEIDGAVRYYYDITLDSKETNRFVTACKPDGNNSYPTSWMSIVNNRKTASSDKTYNYYLILY
ncbi:MAG: hypothetical protein K1W14_15915 [Muribaculaceae bacterium]|jgi:hypothetical protein